METVTLAKKLGTTTHLSALLKKAQRLGLGAEGLEWLAIQRGCDYYDGGRATATLDVSREAFSDAELAVALLSPALRYRPQSLRLGAAMAGSERNSPEELAYLAVQERAEIPLRYVAEVARKFEPENPFWPRLLARLPATPPPKPGVMPHATRFVAMTGLTRRGKETVVEWIRPTPLRRMHG